MPLLNIVVHDNLNLHLQHKKIIAGAIAGIHLATEDGANWIRKDVINGQLLVGDVNYPDVKPETAKYKKRLGREKVGRFTGNFVSSVDTDYCDGGLTGIIHMGGPKYKHFVARWQFDKLFAQHRGEFTRTLIKESIKNAV